LLSEVSPPESFVSAVLDFELHASGTATPTNKRTAPSWNILYRLMVLLLAITAPVL